MNHVAQRREFVDLIDLEAPSSGWQADSRSRRARSAAHRRVSQG